MKPFVFELYTEEIPAGYQASALRQWQEKIPQILQEYQLDFNEIFVGGTAKRLLFSVKELSEQQRQNTETVKGPPKSQCFDSAGQPTAALLGFAQKVQREPKQVAFEEIKGQSYAMATIQSGGKSLPDVLPALLKKIILSTKFPKVMRWNNLTLEYPRPILGYLCVFDQKHIRLQDDDFFYHIEALPALRYGYYASSNLVVNSTNDYFSALDKKQIVVDAALRREKIETLLKQAADNESLSLVENKALLNEVNFLVEHPQVVVGQFDEEFLRLPDVLILSEMADHQRYFGLRQKNGDLSNKFLIVANKEIITAENSHNIKAGNQRVLRARLSDGAFFFDEDMKEKLVEKVARLNHVVYQDGMGSMFDKKNRLERLALQLNSQIFDDKLKKDTVVQIANLCKADLTTKLVYEFDHLQGHIGKVYALKNGEAPEVAEAIYEHYLPKSLEQDDFPHSSYGILFSLADKLDNIISGFLLDKQPTSSQDPLALRRQALAIIEIIIRNRFRLDYSIFINEALKLYPDFPAKETLNQRIWEFLRGRLETILTKRGFSKILVRAVLEINHRDIFDLYRRVEDLLQLQQDDRFDVLMSGFTRLYNIVSASPKTLKEKVKSTDIDQKLFEKESETKLLKFAISFEETLKQVNDNHYGKVYECMISAKAAIDEFFNEVMVNHEVAAIKENRLKLLRYIIQTSEELIDLKQLK